MLTGCQTQTCISSNVCLVLVPVDKHHELFGWVLSPLHPAHSVWLVQKTKWTRGGAARVPAKSQHQVQKVRTVSPVQCVKKQKQWCTVLLLQTWCSCFSSLTAMSSRGIIYLKGGIWPLTSSSLLYSLKFWNRCLDSTLYTKAPSVYFYYFRI